MVNEKIRKQISDMGYENSIVYDDPSFDNSIIGITDGGKVVYDYNLMAEEYVKDDGQSAIDMYRDALPEGETMTDEEITDELIMEAFEFIDYNTVRATPYMGPLAPVIVQDMEYMEDEAPCKYMDLITGEPFEETINKIE